MWIYLNKHVCDLKLNVCTSFLRTMYKLNNSDQDLCLRDLVEPGQKTDTLSKHLKSAVEAGLLERKSNKFIINGEWKSLPNTYTICDPTHKIWIEEEISDVTSYIVQKSFGKTHSKYYMDKFEKMVKDEIRIEEITSEDIKNNYFRFSFEFMGKSYYYTQ